MTPTKNPAVSPAGPARSWAHFKRGVSNMTTSFALRQPGAPPPLDFEAARPIEHIVREGRLTVGPALAERILAEANYVGQRPIRQFHVEDLASHMRRGAWSAATQLYFGRLGERLHLVNGQHRVRAVVVADADIVFQIAIEDVDSIQALAALFYRHDRLSRGRSTSEVLTAVGVGERYDLSAGMCKSVFNAMPLIVRRFERPNYQTDAFVRDDDARLAAAQPWWPTAVAYEGLIKGASRVIKKRLINSQITAVALATIKHQPTRATEFWQGIAENDGLRKGDPRKTFIEDAHDSVGSSVILATVASIAWNAFFEARNINSVRVIDGSPVRINGTPFGARKR